MSRRNRPNPRELTVRDARDRYLRRRSSDSTEQSLSGWFYRLKVFAEWCEGVGIECVGELRGYDIDEFYELRSANVAPATLEGDMWTLKKFLEFLEDIEAVDDGLSEKVRIPDLDPEDRSDNTKLASDDAIPLLKHYRAVPRYRATRAHALLELAWMTGARQGGLRALDLRDANLEDCYVEFFHRPNTGTPLKNKQAGQRPVAIPPETAAVLQEYIDGDRYDVHDEHGRQPLLASAKGRPGPNTVRVWSYLATQPCIHSPCPHGKEQAECLFTERAHASKCPSSRSPHKIRTGSITWQLNIGLPPEVVAERVNASLKTIESHYDKASADERARRLRERMERQRRHYINQIDLENDSFHID